MGWREWSKATAARLKAAGVEPVVIVRRDAGEGELAAYQLEDLGMPHEDADGATRTSGSCEGAVDGAVLHSCSHGEGPHWIRLRIVAEETDPRVLVELRRFLAEPIHG